MAKFTNIEGKEVWIHGKHVGFIVDKWFYPAGVQLAAIELEEIAEAINAKGLPSFDVIKWYQLPDGRREATVKIQLDTMWPSIGTLVRLDGGLYTVENINPRHPLILQLTVVLKDTAMWQPGADRQAKDRLKRSSIKPVIKTVLMPGQRRPVANDQSDSISRSMKPSGEI